MATLSLLSPPESSAFHSRSHVQSPTCGASHSSRPDSASLHWSILRYVFLDLALPMRLFDIPAIKVCSLSRPGTLKKPLYGRCILAQLVAEQAPLAFRPCFLLQGWSSVAACAGRQVQSLLEHPGAGILLPAAGPAADQ